MQTLLETTLLAQANNDLWSTYLGIAEGDRYRLLVTLILSTTAVFITVPIALMAFWAMLQRHRSQAQLKREMLDRGMSAEEIISVVYAVPPDHLRTPPGT